MIQVKAPASRRPHSGGMRRLAFPLCVALLLCAPALAAPPSTIPSAAVASQLGETLNQLPGHGVDGEPVATAEVRAIYAALGNTPLWQLDPRADERRQALEAAIAGAADQALRAEGLHGAALARLAHPATARHVAARDVLLTDAALDYASQLRRGAADAAALGPDWHIAPDGFDAVHALTEALRGGQFAAFLSSLAPADPQYRTLLTALQHYRALVRAGGWAPIPGRDEVKLDGRDPRLPALRNRLTAEGYLPIGRDGDLGTLSLAVRAFQTRHGLDADARIGQRTLAALNVDAEQRANQIAANLERWRHLPRQFGPRYIAVNLADQSLELVEEGTSTFHTRVIVGDTRHQSPMIRATVTGVTFNPPWNVPPSIAVREMLPRLKRDPHYLAANDIVIVGRGDDDPFGLRVDWRRMSGQNFPFRLQQRPGVKNSLGVLKLEMANPWNVYLHDTPVKQLFARAQRGFSHGCIRVQQPGELARRLLDDPAWDGDAIAQGIAAGDTHTVPLRRPVPVYLLYWTAFVDADGAVNFRDDLYGRDAPVELALDLNAPANATQLQRTASCSEPNAAAAALSRGG
ncbi:MAG TPA: L,D-transpeptidase family protein [Alphaproteobacteria bacterium]|nr:L,D-transpeptidase family protein [Alphaproteobacteria bacterium]